MTDSLFSGGRRGDLAISADEVSVMLPKKKTVQVSARIPGEDSERLDHLVELLKAYSQSIGEPKSVEKKINESHALRDVIALGLDAMLDKFKGWPKSAEARAAQIEAVRTGVLRPSNADEPNGS